MIQAGCWFIFAILTMTLAEFVWFVKSFLSSRMIKVASTFATVKKERKLIARVHFIAYYIYRLDFFFLNLKNSRRKLTFHMEELFMKELYHLKKQHEICHEREKTRKKHERFSLFLKELCFFSKPKSHITSVIVSFRFRTFSFPNVAARDESAAKQFFLYN